MGPNKGELCPNRPTLNAHISELSLNIPKLSPNKSECFIIRELGTKRLEWNQSQNELGLNKCELILIKLKLNPNRSEFGPNKFELNVNIGKYLQRSELNPKKLNSIQTWVNKVQLKVN